jgi:hypothetical protein
MDYNNNYVMPTTRGTNNQIMISDGNGVVTWQTPTAAQDHDWYKSGTTTAPTSINDTMFHTGFVGIGEDVPNRPLVIKTQTQDTAVIITQKTNLGTAKSGLKVNMLDEGAGNSTAIQPIYLVQILEIKQF